MILAHQYLGQLDPKLQEAFGANTSIKFAGGVSAKDARSLAPMLHCEASLIEEQPRMSFAASIRGKTKTAIPLSFPIGHMEKMEQMTTDERNALREMTRDKYAVHHSKLNDETSQSDDVSEEGNDETHDDGNDNNSSTAKNNNPNNPDIKNTDPSDEW